MSEQLKLLKVKAEPIVTGLYRPFCPDVLAHVVRKKKGPGATSIYKIYIHAYLSKLENDMPAPIIAVLPAEKHDKTEVKKAVKKAMKEGGADEELKEKVSDAMMERTIQITYTSKQANKPPYTLWNFYIKYSVPNSESVPMVRIDLRNTDPETSRGTYTTPEDDDED